MNSMYEGAIYFHECFLSFCDAGFTDEQALELTKNQQTINAQYVLASAWLHRDPE